MPNVMVEIMNQDAIKQLVGDPTLLTTAELEAELELLNLGATQAILALA
jgi:hypothetical protein